MVRLARANALRLHTFTQLLWPGRAVWNRDPDWLSDAAVVATMAVETTVPQDVARATCLKALEGIVFGEHRPNARTIWIRPIGVFHRRRRRPGLQFCPRCLAEDPDPYFRLPWRLGFVTTCCRHGCILRETCPRCDEPVNFHRVVLTAPLWTCWHCGFDLRAAATSVADSDVLAFQATLGEVVLAGFAPMGRYGPVHSLAFFVILRQLTRLVASGRAAAGLRRALARRDGIVLEAPVLGDGSRDVERLPPDRRHDLLRAASALLDRWPDALITACRAEGIWSSSVLRDLGDDPSRVPFALADPVRAALDRTFYRPNSAEVDAMRLYLARRGLNPTYRQLRKLTGIDSNRFLRQR